MSTIWFPAPVIILFRRLVNVVSTFSISHHYLLQKAQPEPVQDDTLHQRESHIPRTSIRHKNAEPKDTIHKLMNSPFLYDPVRKPRNPIALCHGLYGFDVRVPSTFPFLRTQYWSDVLSILKKTVGAEVVVTAVPGTGSISSRAESMDRILRERAPGKTINFLAHSMGGLDCRHLITHIKPTEYTPVSLTTVATPHRGSPFMDWCAENIGLGKLHHEKALAAVDTESSLHSRTSTDKSSAKSSLSLSALPSSFTTLLLSLLDSPAYANLTSTYLTQVFNPATPDDMRVRYFSVAGRVRNMHVWHPLWLPKMVLDGYEARERTHVQADGMQWGNDALVTVQSARWGEFLGILEGCDHWEMRGARGIEVDFPTVPGFAFGMGAARTKPEERAQEAGWSLGDWGKLMSTWKRKEKAARSAGAAMSERREAERRLQDSSRKGIGETADADGAVRIPTVLDEILEEVVAEKRTVEPDTAQAGKPKVQREESRSELATKKDLERFYVALCRKLYDEGL